MEEFQALRIIALKNVMVAADVDAQWRKVCRWYSKTFSTSLREVEDIPVLDVWQAFFEDRADGMENEEQQKELQDLLKPEDPIQRSLQKSQDDSSMDRLLEETRKENRLLEDTRKKKSETNKVVESLDSLGKAITDIKSTLESKGEFSLDFDGLGEINETA